jgi:hypothetical protein
VLFGRCVHEVYKNSDPDELIYFNYIYLILNTCLAVDKELKSKCYERQAHLVTGDVSKITSCVDSQWTEFKNN